MGRVLRGGAYNNNENNLRGAYRNNNRPNNRNNNIGFRVVRHGFRAAGILCPAVQHSAPATACAARVRAGAALSRPCKGLLRMHIL